MNGLVGERTRGIWAFFTVAVLALWLTFSNFQAHHNSDSLIPVLVSILHWTPFYWDQDRYGMIIPALAQPFAGPMAKFLVVTGINALSGGLAFLAVARVLVGRRTWVSGGLMALFLFLWWAPMSMQISILSPYQFFATPLVLLCAGFTLTQGSLRARRRGLAWALVAALSCLACWVNMASPLLACMLWGGLGVWRRGRRRDGLFAFGTLVLGSLVNLAMVFTFDHQRVQFRFVPLALWPESIRTMARHLWDATSSGDGNSLLLVWTAAGVVFALLERPSAWTLSRSPAEMGASPRAAWASVALYAGVVAVQRWTRHEDYSERFWHPALLVALVLATAILMRRHPARWRALGVCVTGLCACQKVYARFGPPAQEAPRRAIEASLGQHTAALLRGGATHVAGDYWHVWPAVFAANIALYDRTQAVGLFMRPVWGLTFRSAATRTQLMQEPPAHWHVAVLPGDLSTVSLEMLGLPPVRVERVEQGLGWGTVMKAAVSGVSPSP